MDGLVGVHTTRPWDR